MPSNRDNNIITLKGLPYDLGVPRVMGILNVTPDSFYAESRKESEGQIAERVAQLVGEGADMIDIGAYSSRSGADDVSPAEEMARLRKGLAVISKEAPDAIVSVDTFRADVARMCVEEFGVSIVNDIAAGELDNGMFDMVARLGVPYIMMHMQGNPRTMQVNPQYGNFREEVLAYFAQRVDRLQQKGVRDVILDPGFGFGKTVAQNYELLGVMDEMKRFDKPLLVGISRKSMIYKVLGTTPQEALNGTTVLNTLSLVHGAGILRVHDVREAKEVVSLFMMYKQQTERG